MADRSKSDVDCGKKSTLQQEIQAFLGVNLDILCVTDLKGNLLGTNKRFEEVLGYTGEEIKGRSFLSFIHEEDITETTEAIQPSMDINALAEFTNRFLCKNGTYKYLEWHSQSYFGNFFFASARDITEKKEIEEQLRNTAVRDKLTGLYNRHYFEIVIGKHMEYADRSDEPLCMLIFDLDHFKSVNDTWGHPVGDDLLKVTAQIINEGIRKSDIVVRFGGEEFLAVLPNTSLEGACIVANKIRMAIAQYEHPVTGKRTVSIGVAQRMKAESFTHWYRRTDRALYSAKQGGRNQSVCSDSKEKLPLDSVYINWRKEWECGNNEIDRQHLEIVELGNRLFSLASDATHLEELTSQLDILLAHILQHFDYEEKVLLEIGYPEQIDHADIHKSLAERALWLKQAFTAGELEPSAFISFLTDDVVHGHMEKVDIKFYPYIKREGKPVATKANS